MAVDDTTAPWFLAQLKPNSARIAQTNLERQGFQTFLPMERVTRRRARRFVPTHEPLFPGYIFVSFDPASGLWRSIRSTMGITRLVAFGAEPVPVPPDIMAGLVSRYAAPNEANFVHLPQPGDQVQLRSGPFTEFLGRVEAMAPEQRVWVLIEVMGRTTRVRVDLGAVAKFN